MSAAATSMAAVPMGPFGVVTTGDGRWAFVSLTGPRTIGVLKVAASPVPSLIRQVPIAAAGLLGEALTPGDRYLLVANDGSGADVLSVQELEQGSKHPLVGTLAAPAGAQLPGSIEVAVSPDGDFVFARDTSFFNLSLRRVAWQDVLMGADTDFVGRMGPELELLLPRLDERSRRLVLGAVARAAGDGGVGAVAQAAGASWQTVADGAAELASGDDAGPGRVRRPGGGRKKLEERDPRLIPALRDLLEASTRGDPGSLITWTTLSVRGIAAELTAARHPCARNAVLRMLHEQGFSTQGNSRAVEGRRHPDRDAQFRYISDLAKRYLAAGDPVISIDTKKKELVGLYARKGAEWRPKGDPRRVRDHDFPDPGGGKAIPYGVYDIGDNSGFVNVGTDHDTAAFAAESVRRWWDAIGRDRYPGAARLLVTCDAGGSNGYRARAWKAELARLAAGTGLEITVCHFPPGTQCRCLSVCELSFRELAAVGA